ncbi:MAG: hypothetical protein M3Z27_09090 [Actinomycetota bacterium]|nr:hypothetical protein [Actinomycetota bacterium]
MATTRTRTSRGLLTVLCAVAAGAISAGPAEASGAQSASGNFMSAPFGVVFSAQRAAGAPEISATGTFTATTLAGHTPVMSISGPVSCLAIVGDRLGLFYRVTSSTPTVFSQLGGGVLVYLQRAANGQPAKVSFLPVPVTHVPSCDPTAAVVPIQSGTLTLTSGSSSSTAPPVPTAHSKPPKHARHAHRRHRRQHRRVHARRHHPPTDEPE